jgi:hypothetical protein
MKEERANRREAPSAPLLKSGLSRTARISVWSKGGHPKPSQESVIALRGVAVSACRGLQR